jgi:hypothetical protein
MSEGVKINLIILASKKCYIIIELHSSSLALHCFKVLPSGEDIGGDERINYLNSSQPQPFPKGREQIISHYQGFAKL